MRGRGVNLLGMFRCPSIGLKPDSRVEGHFVEWEFEALREWGFNFARLPLDYRILTTGDELNEKLIKKQACADFPPPWNPTKEWDREWSNDRRWS